MPPSQKCSSSMTMDGKPGGKAPDAMMCSGPIRLPSFLNSKLSKYLKLPDVTPTAPTLSRVSHALMRSKSTSLQRRAQGRGVVIALRLRAALRPQRRGRKPRREESGHAEGGDQGGA